MKFCEISFDVEINNIDDFINIKTGVLFSDNEHVEIPTMFEIDMYGED